LLILDTLDADGFSDRIFSFPFSTEGEHTGLLIANFSFLTHAIDFSCGIQLFVFFGRELTNVDWLVAALRQVVDSIQSCGLVYHLSLENILISNNESGGDALISY
jgi:formate/nitrite transporter FocA (FNT family)